MNRIQKKIWSLTLVVLFIMVIIWAALTYYNQKTQDQYNAILQRYLSLNEVTAASQDLITDLNDYLLQPSEANLNQLGASKANIQEAKSEILILKNEDNEFAMANYMNLIDSLMETTDRSLMYQKQQETEASTNEFSEATRISNYISETTLTLIDTELKTYERLYREIIERSNELKKLGIWLLLLITFLLLLMTYWFSKSITKPVQKLTQSANELAKGRFDLPIKVESNDEISFLAETFDRMRININNLFMEIQEKAQLEHELQQNKLLLKESQLQSLQNQINPHFLFNTLNIMSKKAYLEGAEETSDLLVSVAGLLRYNLKRLDKPVTLHEEVIVLKQYMEIQKARFTERLHLHMEIDESSLGVQMPGLTLQPVIENAVIHTIEPSEEGGNIWFRISHSENIVIIEIEDDGQGMTEEKVKQILRGNSEQTEGQSTGIGFSNVVKRLRLFYGQEDVIEIQSAIGQGTNVMLKIPKKRRNDEND
ncbi:sensor histidine kinase [Planomicrobium sp. CPCC 101079]|uniref:sensor histidine kinase n=1 Tax=Planomicrobium sp. CPCC 101079 TaxID=2599618 RepID=UPI0011B4BD25|nr:sensor histidine kinase [Planomicrobium sp. CPCC 101079]TWT01423.1 sensor histidine kinase [Planomicrobium sp. CPCC 101079]